MFITTAVSPPLVWSRRNFGYHSVHLPWNEAVGSGRNYESPFLVVLRASGTQSGLRETRNNICPPFTTETHDSW